MTVTFVIAVPVGAESPQAAKAASKTTVSKRFFITLRLQIDTEARHERKKIGYLDDVFTCKPDGV